MAIYIVTGCAGFIGARVTEFLLADGYAVVGLDNLNQAYDVRLKEWRLAHLQKYPNFTFHRLDICENETMRNLVEGLKISKFAAVIHLAAYAGVRPSVVNPHLYYQTNVLGTLNLLEFCRELEIKKFILASTSSVYGAHNPLPFQEDANTDAPLSPYAASKKAAETLCYTYHYLYNLDITVLRYFTVYGPAGRPDMSIFHFIQRIAEGCPITLYGDGTQQRDFTYIDDIAQGTLLALKPAGYEVINLGSDRPVKLLDVIRRLEKLLERKAVIEYRPRHPADVPATWSDITKARRLLGWRPQVPLEEGLQKAVDWHIKNRQWAERLKVEEV